MGLDLLNSSDLPVAVRATLWINCGKSLNLLGIAKHKILCFRDAIKSCSKIRYLRSTGWTKEL
jgi:hypothetical protein